MANQEHTPSTLAHEIGHALGLNTRPTMADKTPGQDEGDVNELALDPYLPVDNLMYSGVGNVGHITLGEVYRMHFDQRSWLWRGRARAAATRVECQVSPVAGGTLPAAHPASHARMAMSKNTWLILALALVVALILTIMGQCASRERSAVGPRPLSDIEAARAWLECIDCEGPFLKRLADLPAARRDSVVRFLGTALREGPDSARTARHDRELMRIWASDSAYRLEVDADGGECESAHRLLQSVTAKASRPSGGDERPWPSESFGPTARSLHSTAR